MRTESPKFSIEFSFSKIALTPGWRFSLTSIMTKQMCVIKNFSNVGSACSPTGLETDLLRLCLKRNTSLNSFFNRERGREEENFCFVSNFFFWLLFFDTQSSVLAYTGNFSMLWYHQAIPRHC